MADNHGSAVAAWAAGVSAPASVADGDGERCGGSEPETLQAGAAGDGFTEYEYARSEAPVESTAGSSGRFDKGAYQLEVASVLQESAEAAQRLAISGLRRAYVRGRRHIDPVLGPRPISAEKRVMISSYHMITDSKAEELVELLSRGRVVARVGGAPGIGKTMRVAGAIAQRGGLRVCQVELNSHVSEQARLAQAREYGIPTSNHRWCREKRAFLACITYADFCGVVQSSGRKRFFADFDVFYFDEAHVPIAEVQAALQYFTVYGQPENSLLLASATVSSDEDNNVVSRRVGEYRHVDVAMETAVASGKLVTTYLRDRTLVLAGSDERVWSLKAYYAEEGVDVYALDTASTMEDVAIIEKALQGDAVTPRVVVAERTYGTGYNLPVSYVITTAKTEEYEWSDAGELRRQEYPLTEHEVTQHMGRSGRGIVVGSGGLVMSPQRRAEDVSLLHSERIKMYLMLVAADIRPSASAWGDVAALMPRGLARDTALRVLSVALPPMLVLRYLGSDGNIAAMFFQAMMLYTQPDHYLRPSRDVEPVGFSSWQAESIGGYFEGDESVGTATVLVPFASPEGLRTPMHTLYAVARRWMTVQRWRPEFFTDGSGSETEAPRMKVRRRPVVPRYVPDVVETPPPVPEKDDRWRFDTPVDQQAVQKKKVVREWPRTERGEASVSTLVKAAERTEGVVGVLSVETKRLSLEDGKQYVEVTSPGGADAAVTIRSDVHDQLMAGEVVAPAQFVRMLQSVRKDVRAFVNSVMFESWGAPWLAVFSTFSNREALRFLSRKGYCGVATQLISLLYQRFESEARAVFSRSNVYRTKFEKLVGRAPSYRRLANALDRGDYPVAQSDRFVRRLQDIRMAHARALICMEEENWFLPDQVTRAQARLPFDRGAGAFGILGGTVASSSSRGYSARSPS